MSASEAWTVERLRLPASDADVRELAALLVDAVESGAAVSFLAPLRLQEAEEWWRKTLASAFARAVFLVARDREGIAGTVQLHPSWAPNQPHRAEIVKLLVHRRCRRAGLGARLMQAIEEAARRDGLRLLTLDAKRGAEAEHLYRGLGWVHVGTIPRFALDPDGVTPHDAVVFYKELAQAHVRPEAPADRAAIHAVHVASFPTSLEAELVDALRQSGRLLVSLVAEDGGAVVGHVAFSPVTVDGAGDGAGLAPVAVLPAFRRRGIADALIRRGLALCAAASHGFAVVLGSPAYYQRFGFRTASRWGLRDEYGGGDAFQALELRPGAIPKNGGLVRYAPEIAAFGES